MEVFSIVLIIFSLTFLILFHELGHFLFARIFKVKVEEFGIFLPPRIFKKKIGETTFSINLLPIGGFLKLYGEDEVKEEKGSFSSLPVSKRILIVLGGALAFWVFSTVLAIFILNFGIKVAISDEEKALDAKVEVLQVFPDSPAFFAKIFPGDEILEMSGEKIEKISQLQKIVKENLGKEIVLKIKRGEKIFEVSLLAREFPPKGQGPLGISVLRTKVEKYSLLESLYKAPLLVFKTTLEIIKGYIFATKNAILGEPTGVYLTGPVGISYLLFQTAKAGILNFLNLLCLISIYLAIFNLLPIPALDGGKILFLIFEAIRKKPIPKKIEEKITAFFFAILIFLLLFVTISDIKRIF